MSVTRPPKCRQVRAWAISCRTVTSDTVTRTKRSPSRLTTLSRPRKSSSAFKRKTVEATRSGILFLAAKETEIAEFVGESREDFLRDEDSLLLRRAAADGLERGLPVEL